MSYDTRPPMPIPMRMIGILVALVAGSYGIAVLHGLEWIIWESMMTALCCWYAACGFHILMLATDFPDSGKPRVVGGIVAAICLLTVIWLLICFSDASKLMALFMVACAIAPLIHAINGRYIFHRESRDDERA